MSMLVVSFTNYQTLIQDSNVKTNGTEQKDQD